MIDFQAMTALEAKLSTDERTIWLQAFLYSRANGQSSQISALDAETAVHYFRIAVADGKVR